MAGHVSSPLFQMGKKPRTTVSIAEIPADGWESHLGTADEVKSGCKYCSERW